MTKQRRECEKLSCVANVDGFCAVERCQGAITRLRDPRRSKPTPEAAAKLYLIARETFDELFGSDPEDTDEE